MVGRLTVDTVLISWITPHEGPPQLPLLHKGFQFLSSTLLLFTEFASTRQRMRTELEDASTGEVSRRVYLQNAEKNLERVAKLKLAKVD